MRSWGSNPGLYSHYPVTLPPGLHPKLLFCSIFLNIHILPLTRPAQLHRASTVSSGNLCLLPSPPFYSTREVFKFLGRGLGACPWFCINALSPRGRLQCDHRPVQQSQYLLCVRVATCFLLAWIPLLCGPGSVSHCAALRRPGPGSEGRKAFPQWVWLQTLPLPLLWQSSRDRQVKSGGAGRKSSYTSMSPFCWCLGCSLGVLPDVNTVCIHQLLGLSTW